MFVDSRNVDFSIRAAMLGHWHLRTQRSWFASGACIPTGFRAILSVARLGSVFRLLHKIVDGQRPSVRRCGFRSQHWRTIVNGGGDVYPVLLDIDIPGLRRIKRRSPDFVRTLSDG